MILTKFGTLGIRPADAHDMAFWLAVRNEPTAVHWSRSQQPIDPVEHAHWFLAALDKPERMRLYLITIVAPGGTGQPESVGIARLDHRKTWTEFSIALAPAWQAKGLGPRATRLMVAEVVRLGWPQAGAIVHGHNQRSIRMFLRAGFRLRANRWLEFRYHDKGAR